MSDTQRSLAALITLLADNTDGEITAQRIRDMLVSLVPSRASYIITPANSAETVIASTGTWVHLAGTSTDNPHMDDRLWSTNGSNIKTYDGTEDCLAIVQGKISVDPGEGNTEWSLTLAKNGTALDEFVASVRFAGPQSGDAETTIPLTAMLVVEPEDTLSLVVRRDAGDGNITATRAVMSAMGFLR